MYNFLKCCIVHNANVGERDFVGYNKTQSLSPTMYCAAYSVFSFYNVHSRAVCSVDVFFVECPQAIAFFA